MIKDHVHSLYIFAYISAYISKILILFKRSENRRKMRYKRYIKCYYIGLNATNMVNIFSLNNKLKIIHKYNSNVARI